MNKIAVTISGLTYRTLRPAIFLTDSESIHVKMLGLGQFFGGQKLIRKGLKTLFVRNYSSLQQEVFGHTFLSPIGLAAGFDYKAELPDILPSIGFGFGTMGTFTNEPYEGNPPPRLGRLIKSKSLLVNKGFKNPGIRTILAKISGKDFQIPIGISIGKTNTAKITTQSAAVQDIVEAFQAAESSSARFSYYELNISCPNLSGNIEFYSPSHLKDLLKAVTGLELRKPLLIKMPISKTDEETLEMLRVITSFPVTGVIFGNLQTNRSDPAILPSEAKKASAGNFSGKPTEKRSNKLIRLCFKNFGNKLIIVGCGGVFSAADAYKKIKLGASLVQLVTGLVYKGPQLPAEINYGLSKLLKADGFSNISEAVGTEA